MVGFYKSPYNKCDKGKKEEFFYEKTKGVLSI